MQNRYLYLGILLLFSFLIGYWWTVDLTKMGTFRLAGNIINVYQMDNKCIMHLGRFIAHKEGKCVYGVGDRLQIVGKVDPSLLVNFQGKIVLEVKEIDTLKAAQSDVGIYEFVMGILSGVRNYCRDIWGSFLPKTEASLLAGIILGDKSDIGREFYKKMVTSGTIHIAVASGYNVMVVGSTTLSLLFWVLRRPGATWLSILVMLFYALLAGSEPPVVRAFIMTSLLYISQTLGRKTETAWILFLSVWLMLIWDPSMLSSVSFQLSVAASVGLMILSPYLERRVPRVLTKISLTGTFSTMLLTAPIIWWHFGRVSFMGLVSNIFVLPLVPPLMLLGVGMLILPKLFFMPTYVIVHLMIRLIEFFS